MSAFLYAATRTPFGRFNGALAGVRPDDLAAAAITSTLARVPGLDHAAIDDVVWGNANGAGEENRNIGRMAALLAGLPVSVPGTTVNRLCGSSLDAAMMAGRMIESGDADVVLTGGVESMTRAPWVLPKPAKAFPAGDITAVSTTLGWRLVNPRMPKEWTASLGEANEQLQESVSGYPASSRTSSPPVPTNSPTRHGSRASTTTWWCRSRARRPDPRRGHPSRIHAGGAGRSQAGLPHTGTGRHHHRGQRQPAQRRRLRGVVGQ